MTTATSSPASATPATASSVRNKNLSSKIEKAFTVFSIFISVDTESQQRKTFGKVNGAERLRIFRKFLTSHANLGIIQS